MRKIVEYITFINEEPKKLDMKINKLLKNGFELYGNPYSLNESERSWNCQAMVKYEEKKEHETDRLQTFLNKDILDILDDQLSNQATKTWKTTVKNRFKKDNISKLKDLKDSWDIKQIFSDNAARNIFGEIIDQLLKFSKQDDKK